MLNKNENISLSVWASEYKNRMDKRGYTNPHIDYDGFDLRAIPVGIILIIISLIFLILEVCMNTIYNFLDAHGVLAGVDHFFKILGV